MSGEEQSLVEWLRGELAADLDTVESYRLRDYVLRVVETPLAAGLVSRTMMYSVVHWVNHNEPGAEISFQLFADPLTADCWEPIDRAQADLLCVCFAGFWYEGVSVDPSNPTWMFALLWLNGAVLFLEPLRVGIAEVRR